MGELNISIPPIRCFIKEEFLYNQDPNYVGKFREVTIFGAKSLPCRMLGFHILSDNGGIFWNLPIHAFMHNPKYKDLKFPFDYLQTWDCFNYTFSYHQFEYLKEKRCVVKFKNNTIHEGIYLGTFDWYGNDGFSEEPSESKCAHLIKLDNGHFCLQPNNKIIKWFDNAFVTNKDKIDWKLNTHFWSAESQP